MQKIFSLSEIDASDVSHSLISFDIFDTLVYRRYLEVNEVHDLTSAYALSLLGQFGKENPGALTLTRYDITNVMKAAAHERVEEPTLEAVWSRIFTARIGHTEKALTLGQKVAAFEYEIDRQNLYAVDGAIEMLATLKAQGKTVIAISDMYFSQAEIEGILLQTGLAQHIDRVFVSAHENLTKHSGNLFSQVWKQFGIDPADTLHLGDNTHSDVAVPTSLGGNAIHVAHAPLLRIQRPDYGRRPDIHMEIGDLSKLFLSQLLLSAQSDGSDRLFFLSRDGCLLHKVLEKWNSPLFRNFFTPIQSEDLFLSRAVTCWLNVNFQDKWLLQSIGHAFWLHHGKATPRQISAMLGVDATPASLDVDKVYHSSTDTFTVLEAYEASGLVENIRASLLRKRTMAAAYLKDAGVLDHQSVHVCDVGYSGTVVRDLNTFFLQEGPQGLGGSIPQVHFHCIASNANYLGNARTALPHVIFQKDVILHDDLLPGELKDSFAWLEMFFKHPLYGPLLGYRRDGDRTVPSYDVATEEDPHHPCHLILNTIESAPSDIVLLWMSAIGFWSQFTSPLIERFLHPDESTIKEMLSDVYEVDAVSGKTRSVVLVAPELSDEEIRHRAQREDYWIPGSLVASRLARTRSTFEADTEQKSLVNKLRALAHGGAEEKGSKQAPKDQDAFDPAFYRRFYRDLSALPNDRALADHYFTHGRLVGRYGSEAAMHREIEALAQRLPRDFDGGAYFMANPDLPVAEPVLWTSIRHYLNIGAAQNRPYHYHFPGLDEAFEALLVSDKISLSEAERQDHLDGVHARILLLRRLGATSAPWLNMLDLQEFNALNFEWCGKPASVAEAVLTFLEGGVERIAPLSVSVAFDPDFYRRQYADVADLSDVDAYRHWLEAGSLMHRAPSEEWALQHIIGQRTYPTAFRWDLLQASDPARFARSTRLDLLNAFLSTATPPRRELAEGPGAGDLWTWRAARAQGAGDQHLATECLREAARVEPHRGVFWHTLGDRLQSQGDLHGALQVYTRCLQTDTPNRWSHINCIRLSADLGFYEKGLEHLRTSQAAWKDMQPWREARTHLFMRWFDHAAHHSYDSIKQDDVRAASHPDARFLAFMNAFVPAVASVGIPAPLTLARTDGPILILSGAGLSERTRWEASLRVARDDTRQVIVFSREQVALFAESLPGASVALYHEVETDGLIVDTLLRAKALGVRNIYWAGPLGRDSAGKGPDLSDLAWSDFLLYRDSREVGRTLRSIHAATMCDDVVLTMPSLTTRFHDLGLRPRLGMSTLMEALADIPQAIETTPKNLRIFCSLVGRPAHASTSDQDAYAARIGQNNLLKALSTLLETYPDVSLLIEGADPALVLPVSNSARVERLEHELTSDLRLAALSRCAIALDLRHTPRDQRSLTDEATWSGIPCLVLSDNSSLRSALTPGYTNWVRIAEILKCWIGKPHAMKNATLAARTHLDKAVSPTPVVWEPIRAVPAAKARPRVLFANLFAPPQTTGGATRVLSDNASYMLAHAGDDYDFAILASDDENSHRGSTRVDSWKGAPVFRIATPQEIDMDWRTYNSEVDALTCRVIGLFKPDLVHIHCLPRLSVAVAEACRRLGIPYVITLHDAWWLSDFPFLVQEDGEPARLSVDPATQSYSHRIGLPRSIERAARLRSVLRHAQELLAVSEEFAQIYRQAGFRVSTIANGVSALVPPVRATRKGRVRLGHLGGLEHHKGAYLVEAALRSRPFQNLSLTILEHARDPGSPLETRWGSTPVTIRGKVPADRIATLYGDMDILLAPSTWPESFGLVTREAAQCGAWVIGSNQGAMGTDIVEGVNGFVVDTTSPADLVRVLEMIDADPERYLTSPPQPDTPLRHADDQARDILSLYRTLLASRP
ncbi:glycosyltransferase [Gluconobacter cerinus]|uniref:glycosyltransferase n=1 Tax=Gluconobacter cerinus TaxID=38307 RepID=UPI001B8D72D0|nr:glycosyltransferase [Gluconobacter cerinus]MBS1067934.1 glycosyltransferase [Gluconobacter cerinus]